MLEIYGLSINSSADMRFFDGKGLRFSWKLSSDKQGVFQESFRLTVTSDDGVFYDSGFVNSRRSTEFLIPVTLPSRRDYRVCVTVKDNFGAEAAADRDFSTALDDGDIEGVWIKPAGHIEGWAPYIRTDFSLKPKEISRAVLYVSGLGCGEYYINGSKLTDAYIDPPMTNYEKIVYYRAYDVRKYLGPQNAFCALLGEGWYSQSRVWSPDGLKYGDCCLWAQLEIGYSDGERVIIATNGDSWKYKYSPVVLNNLYGGETYDSRLETKDVSLSATGTDGWGKVKTDEIPKGRLTICPIPPVRIIREVPAVSVKQVSGRDDGAWIIDMGENFAGIARFKLRRSPRGAQVVFRYAETVNPDGSLDFRSAGSFATQCIQQDIYIARGDEDGEIWQPRFTYHAFRYIEITGYHDLRKYGSDPETDVAVGLALSTDLVTAGSFVCSDDDVNRLQKIMLNTFRSNYHGFPEDCPGREKCGWLGDAQIVCGTGIMNYDLEACYEKYLTDIRTERDVYGTWQMISPGKRGCGEASPLWGCAQVLIPYWLYVYYGDSKAVYDNLDYMSDWVEHEKADAEDYIITRGLGDWCPPGGHETATRIPVPESSTAMFYEICVRMAELCLSLGLPKREYYLDLAGKIKDSFNRHFWLDDIHRYSTAGTCGVALSTGLYPDGEEENLFSATLGLLKSQSYGLTTGIYGTKYLVSALCERDRGDIAYALLFNPVKPSYKTMMEQGATSLWEALDMILTGTPRTSGTASYNHPMHSGFAYAYYAYIAGIKPLKPGFEAFEISPCRFEKIDAADVSYESPYGRISVSFRRKGGRTDFDITVPCGTTCVFRYDGTVKELLPGSFSFTTERN